MEYVYGALLLNAAGKPIDEKALTGVLSAAGVAPDAARVKALLASLEGVISPTFSQKPRRSPLRHLPRPLRRRRRKARAKRRKRKRRKRRASPKRRRPRDSPPSSAERPDLDPALHAEPIPCPSGGQWVVRGPILDRTSKRTPQRHGSKVAEEGVRSGPSRKGGVRSRCSAQAMNEMCTRTALDTTSTAPEDGVAVYPGTAPTVKA